MASTNLLNQIYVGIELFMSAMDSDNWHFGYWPENHRNATLEEAQHYMTDLVISKLSPRKDDNVLDVGCGIGGPAVRLAAEKQCTVTGITIIQSQVEKGQALAKRENLDDRVFFKQADGADLPFDNGAFTSAMAIESLSHIPNTQKALSEIARVLKPGGTFVFSDGFIFQPMDEEQRELFYGSNVTNSFTNFIYTRDELSDLLNKAGFEVKEMTDITRYTQKTMRNLVVRLFRKRDEICEFYDGFLDKIKKDVLKVLDIYKNLGYIIGTCMKKK